MEAHSQQSKNSVQYNDMTSNDVYTKGFEGQEEDLSGGTRYHIQQALASRPSRVSSYSVSCTTIGVVINSAAHEVFLGQDIESIAEHCGECQR